MNASIVQGANVITVAVATKSVPKATESMDVDDDTKILSFLPNIQSQRQSVQDGYKSSTEGTFPAIKEESTGEEYGRRGEKEKPATTFWPERPTKADPSLAAAGVKANTVLTNLQRGNIPTMQTIVMEPAVTSLHQRAGQGELRAAELPHLGSDIDERDHRLRTPLMWSAFYGQTPTVSLLLANGAEVNAEGDECETALHLAATSGHHDVVKVLLTNGAHVDALDENSCTPLMFAAMQNHPHAVNELLHSGADITLKNINDDTAVSLAVKCEALQAQAVLEQHIVGFMRQVMQEIK